MLKVFGELKKGYNEIARMNDAHHDVLMDVGLQTLAKGESLELLEEEKETALLLLSGNVDFCWGDGMTQASRSSLFDENPTALHLPRRCRARVTADSDAELIIQKTTNEKDFAPVLYGPADIITDVFGENVWGDTARRMVRTVFDFNNAPYSNMVLGEVINFPGRWSSYIPHWHEQPEVYFYRFDRESGFGAAFLGDEAYKIRHNSAFFIPGGPTHPQVSAPGYAMYYCWMIRHLENNPWTSRINDEAHTWLLEADAPVWPY